MSLVLYELKPMSIDNSCYNTRLSIIESYYLQIWNFTITEV